MNKYVPSSDNIWVDMDAAHIDTLESLWALLYPDVVRCLDELSIRGDRIADVACGTGILSRYLSPRCREYVGMDSSPELLKRAMRKNPALTYRRTDIFDLDAADGYFDLVVCKGVLFHINHVDLPRAISELARISKGDVVLNVRIHKDDRDFLGYWGESLSIMSPEFFAKTVAECGLSVVRFSRHKAPESIRGNEYTEYYYLLRKV